MIARVTRSSYNGYLWKQVVMGSVGVKELKHRLTHYLRHTKQGEGVIVIERGKPIALLQPIRSPVPLLSREARLAARGLLTLPTSRRRNAFAPLRIAGRPASQIILEDRR